MRVVHGYNTPVVSSQPTYGILIPRNHLAVESQPYHSVLAQVTREYRRVIVPLQAVSDSEDTEPVLETDLHVHNGQFIFHPPIPAHTLLFALFRAAQRLLTRLIISKL